MVDKPGQIPFISGVNYFTFWRFHQVCTCWVAILLHSGLSLLTICREYLSDILHDEVASENLFTRKQPCALTWGWAGINARVLMFLELSVLAQVPTITCVVVAFRWHHAVEASFSAIIRYVAVFEIIFLINFRSTVTWLDLVAFWSFAFTFEVNVFSDEGEKFETFSEPFETAGVIF